LDHNKIISPIKGGWKKHQQDFSRVDYHHVVEAHIMDDVSNGVSLRQAAQARLDNLGYVKSHSSGKCRVSLSTMSLLSFC